MTYKLTISLSMKPKFKLNTKAYRLVRIIIGGGPEFWEKVIKFKFLTEVFVKGTHQIDLLLPYSAYSI